MDPGRWARMKETFQAARECEPAQREARVRELCAGDEALRTAVNGMLAHDSSGAGFLEAPALEIEARAMALGLDGAGVTDSRVSPVPAEAKRAPAPIELLSAALEPVPVSRAPVQRRPLRPASPVVGPVCRRGLSRRLPAEDLGLRLRTRVLRLLAARRERPAGHRQSAARRGGRTGRTPPRGRSRRARRPTMGAALQPQGHQGEPRSWPDVPVRHRA